MKRVIKVEYDETHQECTGDRCTWRGCPYDEPLLTCPWCFGMLRIVTTSYREVGQ